ncbi:hypothetical protein BGY98DRAFT_916348 [Russula aff. rugulosa BPL654]|nr:hypothetical protein BGY98DRAFT_916348 [Russula aff. rugulosa BPL654]
MWAIYEGEAKTYDGELSEAQKRDADAVLVFTGLFSAVVAVFLVESYKKLSPDSGDTTTSLLSQISQQLTGFQNNTYPRPQETAPFSPTLAILFVNALWFLSLVTAIASAFYVMLVQQWIRRYTQTLAELTDTSNQVRSCLFIGSQKYKLSHAIGWIPLPLHISVFLFLSGLIIFLFTISNAIAIALTVAVGLIGLAYAVLTFLPFYDEVCPYFTPMSYVCWNLYHSIISAATSCCYFVVGRFRDYSGSDSDEEGGPGRLSIFPNS